MGSKSSIRMPHAYWTIDIVMGVLDTPWVAAGHDGCADLPKTAARRRLSLTTSAMTTILPVAGEVRGQDVSSHSLTGFHGLVHRDRVVALEADNLNDVAGED